MRGALRASKTKKQNQILVPRLRGYTRYYLGTDEKTWPRRLQPYSRSWARSKKRSDKWPRYPGSLATYRWWIWRANQSTVHLPTMKDDYWSWRSNIRTSKVDRVDGIIDDTPEAVTHSFDPIRREIACMIRGNVVKDGRSSSLHEELLKTAEEIDTKPWIRRAARSVRRTSIQTWWRLWTSQFRVLHMDKMPVVWLRPRLVASWRWIRWKCGSASVVLASRHWCLPIVRLKAATLEIGMKLHVSTRNDQLWSIRLAAHGDAGWAIAGRLRSRCLERPSGCSQSLWYCPRFKKLQWLWRSITILPFARTNASWSIQTNQGRQSIHVREKINWSSRKYQGNRSASSAVDMPINKSSWKLLLFCCSDRKTRTWSCSSHLKENHHFHRQRRQQTEAINRFSSGLVWTARREILIFWNQLHYSVSMTTRTNVLVADGVDYFFRTLRVWRIDL